MHARDRPDDTVRMLVLADRQGTILGAFGTLLITGDNPPAGVEVVPSEGQVVREVDVPSELLRMDSEDDVFAKYRLEFDDDGGRLVER